MVNKIFVIFFPFYFPENVTHSLNPNLPRKNLPIFAFYSMSTCGIFHLCPIPQPYVPLPTNNSPTKVKNKNKNKTRQILNPENPVLLKSSRNLRTDFKKKTLPPGR
jgi:hypothetical protein